MGSSDAEIQLLPEALANQIAAGEVVQRPASVVKELLENSRDAGAGQIQLIIQDAGKKRIQVVDDGAGMSPPDARMAFERHATSKIRKLDDLFNITTFGFRGEALASIAAVAHVELKTRRPTDELGTLLEFEGGKLVRQEACQTAPGTSIAVKNLFFNVPARRNFLKSNPVETRHILAEFHHMAIAWPDIRWRFRHNEQQVYDLAPCKLPERLIQLNPNLKPEQFLRVAEETSLIKITGYVGVPEIARKTRGNQYFFVNRRYIKSNYLNHSVRSVYEDLIAAGEHPFYAIFLELSPAAVDINIHPTKTEVKFEDERMVYTLIKSAVRKAVGQHHQVPLSPEEANNPVIQQIYGHEQIRGNRGPTIRDFLSEHTPAGEAPHEQPSLRSSKSDSEAAAPKGKGGAEVPRQPAPSSRKSQSAWNELYALGTESAHATDKEAAVPPTAQVLASEQLQAARQLGNGLVVWAAEQGLVVLSPHRAHYRVQYEKFTQALADGSLPVQKLLYPYTIALEHSQFLQLNEVLSDLRLFGFQLEPMAGNTLLVTGLPAGLEPTQTEPLFEELAKALENKGAGQYFQEKTVQSLARRTGLRPGQRLPQPELQQLLEDLRHCEDPGRTPEGLPVYFLLGPEELQRRFQGK